MAARALILVLALLSTAGCREVPAYQEGPGRYLSPRPVDCAPWPGAAGGAVRGPGCATAKQLKVAFLGDQDLNRHARSVLALVAAEGAQAVVHAGDFDYQEDPGAWERQINAGLSHSFPYFSVLGNHDLLDWPAYQRLMVTRLARVEALAPRTAECAGDLTVRASCSYRGLFMVMVAMDLLGDDEAHLTYLEEALARSHAGWKVCVWHKNQHDTQPGSKVDEVGWRAYQICQAAGALIVTGHHHGYGRTRTLRAIGKEDLDHGATGPLDAVELGPGRTAVVVSGLAGRTPHEVSPDQTSAPWWGSLLTADYRKSLGVVGEVPDPLYGALFVTFHVDGDPAKARAEFKTTGGEVVDHFTLRSTVE